MKIKLFFLKAFAIVLPVFALLILIGAIAISDEIESNLEYDNYYSYEITDAFFEKQEDGRYLITAVIKNNSSYQTFIDKNSVQVIYGNNSRAENQISLYNDTDIYATLNRFLLPAGQTIEFPILVELPEEVHAVTLSYYGDSYSYRNITGNDDNKPYKLTLK